jgi:biopolymer transport protein ExbD
LPPQSAAVLDEATPGVKKKAKRGFNEAAMDMTPMVDVTFQLLIFFMLTAAFTITQAQQFPKPEQTEESTTPKPPEEDPDFIIVRIDADNTYFVSGGDLVGDEEEAPSPQELLMKLKSAREGLSGRVATKLLIKAHGDCTHERVVTAIDVGNDVGIEEVRVQTIEDEE